MRQKRRQISYNRRCHKILSVILTLCLVLTLSGISMMAMQADVVFAGDRSLADGAAVDLATVSAGTSLSSGVYYLSESKTFGSASTNNNGLKITSGATVYIYIPKEVTLTAIGGGTNAARTAGGYAGILLPSSSKLILLGEGAVVATGGRAGNGASGSSGGSGYVDADNYYYGGSGGAGGAGGGGAGAGIGTNGGTGGAGGSSTGAGGSRYDGDENYCGSSGNSGSTGGTADSCGTLYKQSTITLTATGGTSGSRGSGGSAGSCDYEKNEWDDKDYHVAGGGGGGGGGGAGYSANGIGTGGAGGGGGGSGGRGGIDYSNSSYGGPATNATCNAGGGNGGTGASSGYSGGGTRDSGTYNDKWDQTGGSGGSGGSAGTGSSSKTAVTGGWTDKSFTVVFQDATEVIQSDSYVFGTGSTIVVPEYTPASGECFLGWTVSRYGTSPVEDAVLTETDDRQYQPGTVISIEAGSSGNIVLEPVVSNGSNIPEGNGRIYFHVNGGIGGPTVSGLTAERKLPANIAVPSKVGYDFSGYYSAMINGKQYYDATGKRVYGAAIERSMQTVNAYARWTVHSSNLYINPNGGVYEDNSETVLFGNYKYGVTVRIEDPVPANNETVFHGWAMSGGNGSLIRGAGYTTFVCGPDTTDVTLKAIWNAEEKIQPIENTTGKEITVSGLESLYEVNNTVSSEESQYGITEEEYVEDSTMVKTVIEITEEDENIESLLEGSSSVALEYYDISVIKTTNGEETKLTELPELITIEIPLTGELEGKNGYSVFRVHNGVAEQMSSSFTAKEYYEIVYADSIAKKW